MYFQFRKKVFRRVRRLNPLSNTRAMLKLNPYAAVLKRQAILAAKKRQLLRDEALAKKRGVSIFLFFFLFSGARILNLNYVASLGAAGILLSIMSRKSCFL